jgi:hypothetical protein
MKEGFGGVQELLSPFNLANWFVTALTLARGIAALVWADKLAARGRPAAGRGGASHARRRASHVEPALRNLDQTWT